MHRKIIISQDQAEYIYKKLLKEEMEMPSTQKGGKLYFISPEKVLIVKRFLDTNFQKGSYENIGANGFPQKQKIVAMLSSDGQVLKNMYLDQLKDLLIDKFQNMFVDEEERSIFIDRVLNDWFEGKIGVFGTLSVNHLNENQDLFDDFEDTISDAVPNILDEFDRDKASGVSRMSWSVIDPVQYKKALELFMAQGPALFRFPDSIIDGWLRGAISNIYRLEATTALYGHTQWFPMYDIADHYEIDLDEIDDKYGYLTEYLDDIGFYDWAVLPDGSWACSDYGFQQYSPILKEYSHSLTAGQKLILLNRIIDVHHCRGNLASAFIKGGAAACSAISNMNESKILEKLASARKNVDRNPTEGQKKAGNFKKGHITIAGMDITIENPKGSYRKGKDGKGKEWKTSMHYDYGYFTKSKGYDGDAVDVFIGPHINDIDKVYVVDQNMSTHEFDESKVMLGFKSKSEAKKAYLSNYPKNWNKFRCITGVSLKLFKKWLYRGRKQQQPFANYVEIKKKQLNESKTLTPLDSYRDFSATDMGRQLEPGRFSNTPKCAEPGFDGWKRVRKGAKMNLYNEYTGELLSVQWFDWVGYMIDGIAIVSNNGKWNYINPCGNLISKTWFDDVSEFNDGFGEVTISQNNGDEVTKRIDRNGNLF